MKYYFLHTQYLANGQTGILPVASFNTKDEAIYAWHNQMTFDMAKDNTDVISTLTLIYTNEGSIVLNSSWQKINEPTPEVIE